MPVPRLNVQGQPVTRWDDFTTVTHPITGIEVPDERAQVTVLDYPNPTPAVWPAADFIIGNPPFIGMKRMRLALGDGYAEALRKVYKGLVPESADFVMYWWHNAANLLKDNRIEKFGFITTNSITMIFNRRVMETFLIDEKLPISLDFVIPDHPWVDGAEGAAVRIAMTVAVKGSSTGKLLTVSA